MTQQFVIPLPTSTTGYGFRTPFGVTLPPGGQVAAFVRSTGPQSGDDPAIASNLRATMAQGMAAVRTGLGDTVIVLPGHAENVVDNTFMANLLPGTRIIGCGTGSIMPTFTWTAAASQWILNQANVQIVGCRLNLGGFNGVTNAIAWTGADCILSQCDISMGTSAALKAVVGITVGAGADRGRISYCDFRGAVAAAVVNGILVSGVVDHFRIHDCDLDFATTVTTVGNIALTAAVTQFIAKDVNIHNALAASTQTFSVANVAATGSLTRIFSTVESATGAATKGLVFAGTATMKATECYTTADPRTNGLLSPAASS